MIERLESRFLSSNTFVIKDEKNCIIVDAGVETEIVKNSVKDLKVLAILLTHGHYDHCYFAEDYAKVFGCKILASQNIKEYLKNPNYNYSDGKFKIEDFSNFELLNGQGIVALENFKIKYKQLGGHSQSDMIYQIGEDIFVGDLLIGRDIGRIDLYGGDKFLMKESLQFLLDANYKTMHSGHGVDSLKSDQEKTLKLWIKFLNR